MKYIVISSFYLNDSVSVEKSFNNIEDAIVYRDIMQRNLHPSKYHKDGDTLAPDYTYEVYEQIIRKQYGNERLSALPQHEGGL